MLCQNVRYGQCFYESISPQNKSQKCTKWIRKEKITGTAIEVNATDFSYQKDKMLLEQIDKFMK